MAETRLPADHWIHDAEDLSLVWDTLTLEDYQLMDQAARELSAKIDSQVVQAFLNIFKIGDILPMSKIIESVNQQVPGAGLDSLHKVIYQDGRFELGHKTGTVQRVA